MNQSPEQIARDNIDKQLIAAGWIIQNKVNLNLGAGIGVAIREYITDVGPADYVLFVERRPVGIIEAKREDEGVHLIAHEDQSRNYAESKLKYLRNEPLPFVYESTGIITRFTDYRDLKPRSRNVFSFHKASTIVDWLKYEKSLRCRLLDLPILPIDCLRDCQVKAINNLEISLKENRPKSLIQMATGSGKTYTAITSIYRLIKFSKAKRILFLVDTKNLGEQAEQEFLAYLPNDDNRKFTELYAVQRLKSSYVVDDSQVCISTIQRLYSILKGEELEESAEEENPNEINWQKREPLPVTYNAKIPPEFFEFIIIDECHRSIYNLWKQVLDYFDAFLIGLTATPDNRTFGFFNQNLVSEYTHEQAVLDGVNVGYNIFQIETEVSKKGGVIWQGEYVDFRDRQTRQKRWTQLDEDVEYTNKQLDKNIVNPNQIRLIIRTFRTHLPEMFPDRIDDDKIFEVPKTLIFAKTDSHADDIIQIVREEFCEENRFCKKITYRSSEDPKSTLAQFRNDYYPRIAVTVDMIATGTDVKPLECLLFMRDVKSRNYFEQMKGRGTRTLSLDDLKKVTPTAKYSKDHFVIVDAIGVTKSLKTDSRPLERKPSTPLKDLLAAVAVGAKDEDLFNSLANRLVRLDKQLTFDEKKVLLDKTDGQTLSQIAKRLVYAYNPDVLNDLEQKVRRENPGSSSNVLEMIFNDNHSKILDNATKVFNGILNEQILNLKKVHDQIIDIINPDTLISANWTADNKEKAVKLIDDFKIWIEDHKDEITALQIFYNQPYRLRELTYSMIKEVYEKLRTDKPLLAPIQIWKSYEQIEKTNGSPKNELTALVSLIRRVCGLDETLTEFEKTVDRNFQIWVMNRHKGNAPKFNEEQMKWLRMIKEYITTSFHIEQDDFELSPFNKQGGLGRMWQLFGDSTNEVLNELNEVLVA